MALKAVILSAGPDDGPGVIAWHSGSDGCGAEHLIVPASGSAQPVNAERLADGNQYLHQDGRAVFKHAVRRMAEAATKTLEQAGVDGSQVDLLVPPKPICASSSQQPDGSACRWKRSSSTSIASPTRLAAPFRLPWPMPKPMAACRSAAASCFVAFGGGFSWGGVYLTWGALQMERLELFRVMLLARRFEERLAALYRQGRIAGGVILAKAKKPFRRPRPSSGSRDDLFAPLIRDMAGRLSLWRKH